MRSRQTSVDAFREIESSGLLSRLRFEVYRWLYENGPATAKEVELGLKKGIESTGVWSTRLSELKRLGVIEEIGKTQCKFSGHEVIEWDVTANLPRKLEKKSSKTIWYGLYSRTEDVSHKIFRTKGKAVEYKLKNRISGEIHEFEQVGK